MHALLWWKASLRPTVLPGPEAPSSAKAWVLTARDAFFFWRLIKVNPALWFGEWVFHVSFLLVALRHLRYFLDPVPAWAWSIQFPGLVAGYILPIALIYILMVRRFSINEKYSSPANMLLLLMLLAISCLGLVMRELQRADLVSAKLFIQGMLGISPAALPDSILFLLHFSLVLAVVPLLPSHILTAPLVMLEAKKRELALQRVMHEE